MGTMKPIPKIIGDYLLSNLPSKENQRGCWLLAENEVTKTFLTGKSPVRRGEKWFGLFLSVAFL